MWQTGLRLLHLAIVVGVVVSANVFHTVMRLFYRSFPFPTLLDWAWRHSSSLRQVFAFRLGGEDGWDASTTAAAGTTVKHSLLTASTRELIEAAGYGCEEHAVVTADGYVLTMHRIVVVPDGHNPAKGGGGPRPFPAAAVGGAAAFTWTAGAPEVVSASGMGRPNAGRPPVLMQHGLMQCSEAWVVGDRATSFAFAAAEAGYDVWLGNNRGNKYCQTHLTHHPDSDRFWAFSLDELARYDVPAMVDHILAYTAYARTAYVGFSQGTAQCFAALSTLPDLNSKLSVFVALSPAVAVRGLARSPLTALVESDLTFLYMLFGRTRMLPSSLDVMRVLSGRAWTNFLDACLTYLFSWKADQIDPLFKVVAFHHLYSFSSVRSVVHWFQIIASGRFAMYRDVPSSPALLLSLPFPFLSHRSIEEHRVPPLYDTAKVAVPTLIIAGASDTLIDIPRLVTMLPAWSAPVWMPPTPPPDAMLPVAAAPSKSRARGSSRMVQALLPADEGAGGSATRGFPSPTPLARSPAASPVAGRYTPAAPGSAGRVRASTASSTMQLIASVVHDAVGGYGGPDDLPHLASTPTPVNGHGPAAGTREVSGMDMPGSIVTAADARAGNGGDAPHRRSRSHHAPGPRRQHDGQGHGRHGAANAHHAFTAVDSDGGTGGGGDSSVGMSLPPITTATQPAPHAQAQAHPSLTAGAGTATTGTLAPAAWRLERQPLCVHVEPRWEHLDTMWGGDSSTKALPLLLAHLAKYRHLCQLEPAPTAGSGVTSDNGAACTTSTPKPMWTPSPVAMGAGATATSWTAATTTVGARGDRQLGMPHPNGGGDSHMEGRSAPATSVMSGAGGTGDAASSMVSETGSHGSLSTPPRRSHHLGSPLKSLHVPATSGGAGTPGRSMGMDGAASEGMGDGESSSMAGEDVDGDGDSVRVARSNGTTPLRSPTAIRTLLLQAALGVPFHSAASFTGLGMALRGTGVEPAPPQGPTGLDAAGEETDL